jgi:hypothetical protein
MKDWVMVSGFGKQSSCRMEGECWGFVMLLVRSSNAGGVIQYSLNSTN